jgi:anti-sigma-K factor RskA
MRDDDLAAEYVLGVQDASVRAELAARVERDPAFAALVRAWETRLAGLNEGFEPVAPPARVKTAIDGKLFAAAARPSRTRWGWLSGALSLGLALGLALLALVIVFDQPGPPELVATLQSDTSDVVVAVEVRSGTLQASLVSGAPSGDQVLELWQIVGDAAPVSLGLLGTGDVLPETAFDAGQLLAVSLEPSGGSPTGAPTGPVVALGSLEPLETF